MSSERPALLITGARKGIGRHLAEHYLGYGYRVFGCSRSPSDLEHRYYTHVQCDVCDEDEVRELFTQVRATKKGRLVGVVNNAGAAAMNHVMLTPVEVVESLVRTNYLGTFLCSREASRTMRSTGGRIVNFTSVAVALSLAGEAAYAASKGAVETLTRVLARELGVYGITVNAVGPTPIATDLIAGVPKEKIDRLVKRQAIRRMGTYEDVANAVDFFLAPGSGLVTGQVVYLGGV